MRKIELKPQLRKEIIRLSKKNKSMCEQLLKKINEIIASDNIEHYKNLRFDMKESKRVHIGHFVLIFSYDKSKDIVSFEEFDHHDNVYL
jgi:YafQ family addiction module toxin component